MSDWPITHVHFALTRGDLIILDVLHDRYVCLAGAADHMKPADDHAWSFTEPDVRAALVEGGFLSSRPPFDLRRVAVPVADELADPAPGLSWGSAVAALGATLATPRFRAASFAEVIADARRTRLEPRDADIQRLKAAVRDFRAGLPWVPYAGLCLQRAYLMRRHLAWQGMGVDWVFGVRTWPFVAHCWLQVGGLVIGDRVDHVRSYDPILVI